VLTAFGTFAVGSMAIAYAFEQRHAAAVLAFACACVLSSAYGFLLGSPPFGLIEAIWSMLAVRRWLARISLPLSGE